MPTTLVREGLEIIAAEGRPFIDEDHTIEIGNEDGRDYVRQRLIDDDIRQVPITD